MIGYEAYRISGSEPEWLLTLGTQVGRQVLIVPPLFEEANFIRTFLVGFARLLAARGGCGIWLPDLPGCGESRRALVDVTLRDWRTSVAAVANHIEHQTGRRPHVAAFRGGALLDDAAEGASCWRFAPAAGGDMLRHMRRAQLLAERETDPPIAPSGAVYLSGYLLSEALVEALQVAAPSGDLATRTVAWPAGSAPLWRRAEPADEVELASELAVDLLDWITTCGG